MHSQFKSKHPSKHSGTHGTTLCLTQATCFLKRDFFPTYQNTIISRSRGFYVLGLFYGESKAYYPWFHLIKGSAYLLNVCCRVRDTATKWVRDLVTVCLAVREAEQITSEVSSLPVSYSLPLPLIFLPSLFPFPSMVHAL